jgi:hypothetical protein
MINGRNISTSNCRTNPTCCRTTMRFQICAPLAPQGE